MCDNCHPDIREVLFADPLPEVDLGDVGEVRKLLPPCLASLSDDEVVRIRDLVGGFVDDAFDWWIRRRNAGQDGGSSHNSSDGVSPSSL